jgi:hypothetical protein
MRHWGPYFWGTLHLACLSAPNVLTQEHKAAFQALVESYTKVLPCSMCQNHFAEVLQKYPLQDNIETSDQLFLWSVTVHNAVNANIGKPQMNPVDALYYWSERLNYSSPPETEFQIEIIAVILLVILISFLMLK